MFTSTAITNRSHLHTQRCTLYWLSSSTHQWIVFLKQQPFNSTLLNNVASKYIFLHPKDPRPPSSNPAPLPTFSPTAATFSAPSQHCLRQVHTHCNRFPAALISCRSHTSWYSSVPTPLDILRFPRYPAGVLLFYLTDNKGRKWAIQFSIIALRSKMYQT